MSSAKVHLSDGLERAAAVKTIGHFQCVFSQRSRRVVLSLLSLALTCLSPFSLGKELTSPALSVNELRHGWHIQSSCKLSDKGENISRPGYPQDGWLPTDVPATVLAAQVANGLFPEPFHGMNLRKIPGTDYPIGKIYGYLPMTEGSPYRCSWWYRTEFRQWLPPGMQAWLHFNGINYRANIWVNGTCIADSSEVAGAFRSYEFDVTGLLDRSGPNAVAVEVFAQSETDLGIDFLDWNPAPADKNMGLWRDVFLRLSGPVKISSPMVSTHFPDDSLSVAELTVTVSLTNSSPKPVTGVLTAAFDQIHLSQSVSLDSGETKTVRFMPAKYSELHRPNPRIWWPYSLGRPELDSLTMRFAMGKTTSDARTVRFGIREITSSLNTKGYRQFQVNRRNILIRGGGWAPDLFYREPRERLAQELNYVVQMNLNAVRLEGKLGSEDLFDLADEKGILIMPGWACCDHWEHWSKWTTADREIAKASLASQVQRLRHHPSVFVWLNGSDNPPPPDIELDYLEILRHWDWPNPILSSASAQSTAVTGPSGVKMTGPYDYVPPEYWYLDKDKHGGAFGFNTETSPGPAIPTKASIQRTLNESSWWPPNDEWNFHAGSGRFWQFELFNAAMKATYGEPANLDDYLRKAQAMSYDGERAMFEAFARNKYTATGVIQWMLNNAWPSFIWHLYDYYLVPAGGFYGVRKANEPLHVQYSYDDRSIVVVNSTLSARRNLRLAVSCFTLEMKELFAKEIAVESPADSAVSALPLPKFPEVQGTVFLKLNLTDAKGAVLSSNFYWLPPRLSVMDWAKTTYVSTPLTAPAEMKDLANLPLADVRIVRGCNFGPDTRSLRLVLQNGSKTVAFQIHARAVNHGTEDEIVPVFWNDNYVSLLPGESTTLEATYSADLPKRVEVNMDGWNVPPVSCSVERNTGAQR